MGIKNVLSPSSLVLSAWFDDISSMSWGSAKGLELINLIALQIPPHSHLERLEMAWKQNCILRAKFTNPSDL